MFVLSTLPIELHLQLGEYLLPCDTKSLSQTCTRMQRVFRPLSFRGCQLYRPSARLAAKTADSDCDYNVSPLRQVPLAVLVTPEKYSWFACAAVRYLDLGDYEQVLESSTAVPTTAIIAPITPSQQLDITPYASLRCIDCDVKPRSGGIKFPEIVGGGGTAADLVHFRLSETSLTDFEQYPALLLRKNTLTSIAYTSGASKTRSRPHALPPAPQEEAQESIIQQQPVLPAAVIFENMRSFATSLFFQNESADWARHLTQQFAQWPRLESVSLGDAHFVETRAGRVKASPYLELLNELPASITEVCLSVLYYDSRYDPVFIPRGYRYLKEGEASTALGLVTKVRYSGTFDMDRLAAHVRFPAITSLHYDDHSSYAFRRRDPDFTFSTLLTLKHLFICVRALDNRHTVESIVGLPNLERLELYLDSTKHLDACEYSKPTISKVYQEIALLNHALMGKPATQAPPVPSLDAVTQANICQAAAAIATDPAGAFGWGTKFGRYLNLILKSVCAIEAVFEAAPAMPRLEYLSVHYWDHAVSSPHLAALVAAPKPPFGGALKQVRVAAPDIHDFEAAFLALVPRAPHALFFAERRHHGSLAPVGEHGGNTAVAVYDVALRRNLAAEHLRDRAYLCVAEAAESLDNMFSPAFDGWF